MNIEIANRLVQLRKKNGLSQEELADKLGLSRQAVSKWERAEASPDTDNLILLARLYGVSLDSLLATEDEIPDYSDREKKTENGSEDEDDGYYCQRDHHHHHHHKEDVHIGFDGIHVKDGDDEVHVSWKGVHVEEKGGDHVHVSWKDGVHVDTKDGEHVHWGPEDKDVIINGEKYSKRKTFWTAFPYPVLVVIIFLLLGFLGGFWAWCWTVFLTIPVYYGVVDYVVKRKYAKKSFWSIFPYPLVVTAVYLTLGFLYAWWHPGWIIFLTIPLYYAVVNYFKKK